MEHLSNKKSAKQHGSKSQSQIDVRMNWSGDYLFNQYPDGVLIIAQDGAIVDANETFLAMSLYEKADLIGKRMEILMPKGGGRADHVCLRKKYAKKPNKRALNSGVEPELRRKDGSCFPVDIMLSPLKTEIGMLTVTLIRDITEKQKILNSEREAKNMLNAVFNSAPVAIYTLTPDEIVLSWSKAAEKLFGYRAEEVIGEPYKLIPEITGKKQECVALLRQVFTGETVRDVQRKRLHKNGSLVDVAISASPMYDKTGNIYAATYAAEDISERLKAQKKLNQLAYFDSLTKLPNQASLQKDIVEHLNDLEDFIPRPISIATIELEGFEEVNNTLGRSSGNKLLKAVAKRLVDIAGEEVKIYRSCKYEFSITIEQCGDPRIIMAATEAMIEQIRKPFEIDNQMVHLSANAGVAMAPLHGKDVAELLANCSLALSAARNDNSRDVRFFSMSIRTAAHSARELDLNLRLAFEQNEFELFFQPQINLSSGKITGAEALLRWRHKDHGIIHPGGFIAALGKNPIAYDVGKWIMRTGIEKAAHWRKIGLGDLRIGVNLFAAQFERNLVEDVADALADFALPAQLLELEITENIALDDGKEIIGPLRKIREMGVSIAFDDFGTGYASLSYLMKYPLNRIKIDKSFLENVPKNSEKKAIVHALIAMSHGLGLEVITEGVETKQHVRFLCDENCEEAQGYFYSKPLKESDFIDYLKDEQSRKIA